MNAASSTKPIRSDRGRGLLAIVDQMIVSGTNFAIVAALGRFAGAETLGQFSIAYSVVVIATTVLRSLLMTPYAVFSHRESSDRKRQMRGAILSGVASIALVTALTTAVAASVIAYCEANFWSSDTATESQRTFGLLFFLVALAIPFWTLRELARQMSFADMRFGRAIWIDGLVSAAQLAAIACLILYDALNAETAMLVLVVTTATIGVGWLTKVKHEASFDRNSQRQDWRRAWRFGRWGAMSQTSHVVQGYALNWILAWTGGLGAAGIYTAVWSIVQLASPFIQGVGNALTPLLARRHNSGGVQLVASTTRRFTGVAAFAATVYVMAIYLLGPFLMRLIYGEKYPDTTLLLVLLAATVAVSALVLIATKVISVLEFPQVNFVLNLVTLAITIVLATLLGYANGINGAVLGLLLAAAIGAAAKWAAYVYVIRRCYLDESTLTNSAGASSSEAER